jgi:hypothetical protein
VQRERLAPSLQRGKLKLWASRSSGKAGRGVLCPQLCLRLPLLLACSLARPDFGVERRVTTVFVPKVVGDEKELGSNGGKSASCTSIEKRNSFFL